MSIEAMKQALEALETADEVGFWELQKTAITALRTAIAEAEKQEPVAWQVHPFDYGIGHEGVYARTDRPEQVEMWKRKGWAVQPLYTNPTSAQRQPLTDEQIDDIMSGDHNMNQKRMRTHKDKLKALLEYLSLNVVMVHYRLNAERFHQMQDEQTSWEYLFRWAEAKDERAKMWKWFQDEYPDAIMLKEGYYETYK